MKPVFRACSVHGCGDFRVRKDTAPLKQSTLPRVWVRLGYFRVRKDTAPLKQPLDGVFAAARPTSVSARTRPH